MGLVLLVPDSVNTAALARLIGHHFGNPQVLRQAFVHRSYLHENPAFPLPSNERLEFLGDAYLGYVIAGELFTRFPDEPEGALTRLRAGVVQQDTLARVARELGLGQHLLLGRGEDRTGGRERAANLSRLYEAIVGALLVDGGEPPAKAFILRSLSRPLQEVAEGTIGIDYKSQLQEFCQSRRWEPPMYRVVLEEGPPHAKRFQVEVLVQQEVWGQGAGHNRQKAEKEAARAALAALQQKEGAF